MRKFIFILLVLWPSIIFNQIVLSNEDFNRRQIILEAEKYLGYKYRSNFKGQIFDCSGYARYVYSTAQINVTRSSVSQVHDGIKVANRMDAKPGDLIVFKGRNKQNNRPGHVGIVHHWSNDTLYFIHSSVSKGVTIDHLYEDYYATRFLQIRNVLPNK